MQVLQFKATLEANSVDRQKGEFLRPLLRLSLCHLIGLGY